MVQLSLGFAGQAEELQGLQLPTPGLAMGGGQVQQLQGAIELAGVYKLPNQGLKASGVDLGRFHQGFKLQSCGLPAIPLSCQGAGRQRGQA